MRVVLDTNIVVSGLLWKRAPHALLQAVLRKEVDAYVTAWLLDELSDVMSRAKLAAKVKASGMSASELVTSYAQVTQFVTPAWPVEVVARDPDDDHVLACALAAQADLIVSGDLDLLELKAYEGIPIVTPVEGLQRIQASDPRG